MIEMQIAGETSSREYEDAVLDFIVANANLLIAQGELVGNTDAIDAFRRQALEAGVAVESIDALIASILELNGTPVDPKSFGGVTPSGPSTNPVDPIFAAASGFHGSVNKPTLFLAGEAGTEQVDITPAGGGGGGTGGTTMITVPVYIGQELLETLIVEVNDRNTRRGRDV